MAISNNPLLANVSGKIGDLVIRQCKGKTVIAKAPERRKQKPTAAQREQQKRFAEMVKRKKQNLWN